MNDENLKQISFITLLEQVWKNSLGVIRDIVQLFSLEVKLAGRSLATILILAVLVSIFLLSSWFSLLGALTVWIMSFHLSLVVSFFIMSAINLVIAVAIIFFILHLLGNLKFKETRKQLELNRQHEYEKPTS